MQQKWNQNFDGEPMTDIPQKFLNAGCDVYMVMQLRHDEKILDERFASMRELNRRGKTPDPEHYEVTYYADLSAMGSPSKFWFHFCCIVHLTVLAQNVQRILAQTYHLPVLPAFPVWKGDGLHSVPRLPQLYP